MSLLEERIKEAQQYIPSLLENCRPSQNDDAIDRCSNAHEAQEMLNAIVKDLNTLADEEDT